MKHSILLAAAAAFLGAGMAQAGTTTYVTNQAQTVTIALTATIQAHLTSTSGTATNATLRTQDIIKLFGNFSAKAKFLKITPPSSEYYFVVRDIVNKTNVVDTDVSDYVWSGDWGDEVKRFTASGGKTTGVGFSLEEIEVWNESDSTDIDLVGNANISLETQGFSTACIGTGTVNGQPANFNGTLTLSAQTPEKVPITGGD